MRVTHGCIRMFPEDIEYLFGKVAVNTPVRIINEPVKIGWDGDQLVMEVHRTLEVAEPQQEEGDIEHAAETTDEAPPAPRDPMTMLTEQFVVATDERSGELDWTLAEQMLTDASGIPVTIGQAIKNAATSAASH